MPNGSRIKFYWFRLKQMDRFCRRRRGAPGKQMVITCYNCKGEDNLAENSALPALQDDLILSVIEQLKT
nr:hypothetical protein [Tanacetum cinerariifolium]